MEEKKIVFVCTGNTCRSPMAEAILRSELRRLNIGGVTVLSAGTRASESETMNPKSAAVLSENGLSIDNFNSRRLDGELLKSACAIICMTDALRDLLMDMRWNILRKEGYAEIENNVYSFSDLAGYEIPDPFGKELDCYRLTYRKLSEGMPRVIERLLLSFSVPEGELLPEVAPANAGPALAASETAPLAVGKNAGTPGTGAGSSAGRTRKPRAKPRKRRSRGPGTTASGSGAGATGTKKTYPAKTEKKKSGKRTGKSGGKTEGRTSKEPGKTGRRPAEKSAKGSAKEPAGENAGK